MAIFATSQEAYELANRRARYAHRDCVVWRESAGWRAQDFSREAIKSAMLACGTRGHFSVVAAKGVTRADWRLGVRMLRSFGVVAG